MYVFKATVSDFLYDIECIYLLIKYKILSPTLKGVSFTFSFLSATLSRLAATLNFIRHFERSILHFFFRIRQSEQVIRYIKFLPLLYTLSTALHKKTPTEVSVSFYSFVPFSTSYSVIQSLKLPTYNWMFS